MLRKPNGCKGCPFENLGDYWVPDEVNPEARVVILAQNPGDSEERGQRFVRWADGGGEIWEPHHPAPLIGKSGWEMDHHFLPLAGLRREDVRCGNVIRCRVRGKNDLPPVAQTAVRQSIRHCQQAYFQLGAAQTVVALGAHALWAVTGEYGGDDEDDGDDSRASHSIAGWRGWVLPYRPQWTAVNDSERVSVFATYHPAFYYRAHWLKPVGKMDFQRLGRYLKGTWPEPFPEIRTEVPDKWPHTLAFDTEYQPWEGGDLIRMSAAWRNGLDTPSPFVGQDFPSVHVIEAAACRTREAPRRIIMHNAEADWPYLRQCFGTDEVEWDDTMYAHSVLYGTWRHTLDFLGSLYARTNRWKHLEQSNPLVYAGGDALGTWDIWQALDRELSYDPRSRAIYEEEELKPLLPHLLRRPPIRLDAQRVTEYTAQLRAEQAEVAARGEVAAGWPLKVTSPDMVARWIGVKHAQGKSARVGGGSGTIGMAEAKS